MYVCFLYICVNWEFLFCVTLKLIKIRVVYKKTNINAIIDVYIGKNIFQIIPVDNDVYISIISKSYL